MHLSIVAYGTWGDVRPSIALGNALAEAGYGVRLIVTEDFADWVDETAVETHLLPVDKRDVMEDVSSRTHPLRVLLGVRREIAPALVRAGEGLLEALVETDAVLVNEWLIGLVQGIAERRGQKLVTIAMKPLIKTGQMPIPTMPAVPDLGRIRTLYNLLTYDIAHTLRWWLYVRDLNRLRRERLRLPPLSARDYLRLLGRTPSITMVSPQVVARPADWPGHHHLTGYLFFDHGQWRPPERLKDFLRAGPPPVYLGFGSMHDANPVRTTRLMLDALDRVGWRAVLYSGWAGLGRIDLPDSVHRLDYAPHSWLFPRMAAVVHHAGAGTSASALRAGVPSIPVPHSGDQRFWARRLYDMGTGTSPLPRGQLGAEALAARILAATRDPNLRLHAVEVGRAIRAEDGAQRTISALNEILTG